MFVELRELLCSGAIRRYQLKSKVQKAARACTIRHLDLGRQTGGNSDLQSRSTDSECMKTEQGLEAINMQVQDLVGIVPWTFVATILNLFIQVYLIKRFLFKPINEILEKRKAHAERRDPGCHKGKRRSAGHEGRI